jgi:membrane protein
MTKSVPSTAKQFRSVWNLGGLSLWQLVHNVFEELIANDLFGKASELAFYFLFGLFSLILLMMNLFGLFALHRVALQNDLLSYFTDFLPPAAFQLVKRVITELAAKASGGKLTFGIVSALWCVSGGINSMISALNLCYHVRETRSWFKVRAIALGLSLLISALLLTALFFVLLGSHFVGWLGTGLRLHPIVVFIWKATQWPAAVLFVIISCSTIYYCGPNLKDRCVAWQHRWSPAISTLGFCSNSLKRSTIQ